MNALATQLLTSQGGDYNFVFKTPSFSINFRNSSIHSTEDEIDNKTNHVLQFKKRVDNNEPISKPEKGIVNGMPPCSEN